MLLGERFCSWAKKPSQSSKQENLCFPLSNVQISCVSHTYPHRRTSPPSPQKVFWVLWALMAQRLTLVSGKAPLHCAWRRGEIEENRIYYHTECAEMIKPFQSVCVTSQVHVQEGEQKRHISRRTSGLAMEQEACRAALVGGCLVCLSLEGGSASWAGPAVLQALMVCDRVSACRLREQRSGEDERRNPVIPSCCSLHHFQATSNKSKHSDVFLGFEALTLGPEIQSPPH